MRFLKAFSISLFSQGAVIVCGFINSIIITRNLSVSGRGKYAIALNIIMLLGLLFGNMLNRSNIYLASINKKNLPYLFTNSLFAIAVISIILISLQQFASDYITKFLPGITTNFLYLVIVTAIPYIALLSMQGLFIGLQNYYAYNIAIVSPFLLFLILNIVLYLFFSFSLRNVVINYLISMGSVSIISILWLFSSQKIKLKLNVKIAKSAISKGLKATFSQIFLYMLFKVDIFLLNYFLGSEKAGIYSIAILVAELLQRVANTSGTVIFPKVTGKQSSQKRQLSIRVLFFVLMFSVLFSVGILFFGKSLIVFAYSDKYLASIIPLYFLLPGTILMAGGKVMLFSLWGQNFPKITFIAPFIAFILNAILNFQLIPKLGVNGAAISTSISYCVFAILISSYFFIKKTPIDSQNTENIVAVE